jgi:apolipoprotein D and lipocalin family protein
MRTSALILTMASSLLVLGCKASMPPLQPVAQVDLERFMGDWYVIANIPTFIEKGAHNAVESYRLDDDGTIATTFTFRKDAFDGPEKNYTPRGFILDSQSNALWGMQFVWPFKGDYRIIYLAEDYSETIIGRNKRDYVWYMARTPQVADERFEQASELISNAGYDIKELRRVPQQW